MSVNSLTPPQEGPVGLPDGVAGEGTMSHPSKPDSLMSRVDHAIRYYYQGWAVLPLYGLRAGACLCGDAACRSPGKHPHRDLVPHGVHDASRDFEQIVDWFKREPEANLGIATGAASGFDVLDVDPRNGGDDTLADLERKHGKLPDTALQLTGGQGYHYLFAHDPTRRLRSPGRGLDVKSTGGYIVVEPSSHVSGGTYAWEGSADPFEDLPIASAPDWLSAPAPTAQRPSSTKPGVGHLDRWRIQDLRAALAHLDASNYQVWIGVGQALHSTSAPEAFELWDTWSQGASNYDGSTQAKWGTFNSSGPLHVESIFTWAADAGWDNPAKSKARPRDSDGIPPALRLVKMAGFMKVKRPPHPCVLEPYFPRRVVTLLGGHGGAGKSTLALTLLAHAAAGMPWGPCVIEAPVRAVFLSFEDEEDDVMRALQQIVDEYGLPEEAIEQNLQVVDCTEGDTELAVESRDGGVDFTTTMTAVEEATAGAAIVVIDNASDTFGGDENSRRQVRAFMRRLGHRIARTNDSSVVLLAHISKDAARQGGKGNNYSGSTAWHNGARSRLALVESDAGLELLHEKAQWSRKAEPLILQRRETGVLSPVAPAAAAAAREASKTLIADADANAILAVVGALVRTNVAIPTAETGQRTAYHVLARAPEMPEQYRTSEGKERVKAALMALERSGRIRRDVYRVDSKDRERWTLANDRAREVA